MAAQDIPVIFIAVVMITAFIYVNTILPQKEEEEKRQKEETKK